MATKSLDERLEELYNRRDYVGQQFNSDDIKTFVDGIRDAREKGGTPIKGATATELQPDETPTAEMTSDGTLVLGIPKGQKGDDGKQGDPGEQGKSAYQVWLDDNGWTAERHPVSEYINSLKAHVAGFQRVDYNSNAPTTIGGTASAIGSLFPSADTMDKIVLMPNSDGTATIMYATTATESGGVTTYAFSCIGELAIDTSDFLNTSSIDTTNLKNPTALQVAKASDVMGLKAKLEGVTAVEDKVTPTTTGTAGTYIKPDNTTGSGTGWQWGEFALGNAKAVRFVALDYKTSTTPSSGWLFLDDSDNILKSALYTHTAQATTTMELVVAVPEGATTFKTNIAGSELTGKFYCYLQSGESVKDMIPAPFEIEKTGEYISAKKISSTGSVSSASTLANLVLKVDVTGRDGETLLLSGTCFATGGGNSYAWWSFKGANNEQLDVSGTVNTRTNYERVPVTVPTGAVTLYVIGTTQAGDVLPRVEYLAGVSGDAVRDVITDATPLVGEVTKRKLDSAGQVQSSSSTTNRLMKIDVSECVGKTLELTGVIIANTSSVNYSWWAIHDENDNVLSHSGEYSRVRATMTDVRVVVPTGAKWLYVFGSNNETSDKEPQAKLLGELRQTAIEEAEKVYGEKELKVLCFGNSYTLDSFQYLPFILKSMYPKLKLTLGIGYIGACPIVQHVVNLDSQSRTCLDTTYNPTNYTYYKYTGFEKISNGVAYTAEKMLADETWDLIVTQQSSEHSWEDYDVTYAPYINDFCRLLSGLVGYNFKLGFVLTHSSRTATKAELVSRYETVVANTREVMETMPFDVIFPYGTAIQSCRTNDDLYSIYGTTAMCGDSPTPVHLCDGFPCLVANYTNALALLNMLGLSSVGIVGEQTRPNLTWCNNHGIQGMNYPNGATLEVTDRLAYYAQMAAINAVKKPYEVTDMSGYDVEEPQEEA